MEHAEQNAPTTPDISEAHALLRDGLAEAQATVRSYDTKAQIVGVGYIFALGVVGQISALLDRETEASVIVVVISWAIVVMPILFFGYVLYPTRKTTSYTEATKHHGIQHVLYLNPTKKRVDGGRSSQCRAGRQADRRAELRVADGFHAARDQAEALPEGSLCLGPVLRGSLSRSGVPLSLTARVTQPPHPPHGPRI